MRATSPWAVEGDHRRGGGGTRPRDGAQRRCHGCAALRGPPLPVRNHPRAVDRTRRRAAHLPVRAPHAHLDRASGEGRVVVLRRRSQACGSGRRARRTRRQAIERRSQRRDGRCDESWPWDLMPLPPLEAVLGASPRPGRSWSPRRRPQGSRGVSQDDRGPPVGAKGGAAMPRRTVRRIHDLVEGCVVASPAANGSGARARGARGRTAGPVAKRRRADARPRRTTGARASRAGAQTMLSPH